MSAERFYIQVRVTANSETRQARTILQSWTALRQTPKHLARAIALYDALRTGDIQCFMALLNLYFPGVAIGMAMAGNNRQAVPDLFAMQPVGKITIETVKRSADEMFTLEDGLGLDDLFG